MAMAFQHHDIKEVIRQEWDESSKSYDSRHGHGIKTEEEREAWKRELEKVLPAGQLDVLDAGCGTGEMGLLLAEMGHRVTGIDLSENMLGLARSKAKASRLKARFERGDAESLKFKDESFDLVINRHLLWTLPHPDAALREWSRVLRQNGKVVVIDGQWRDGSAENRARRLLGDLLIIALERCNPWKGWYPKETEAALPHPRGMSAEQAKAYMEETGLVSVNLTILKDIRDIQRKYMPLSQKIAYGFAYYMVNGGKQ